MRFPRVSAVCRRGSTSGLSLILVLLICGSALAAGHQPTAIRADKVSVEVLPDATARFGCELRPFDLSRGLFCYGPAAIRAAYGLDGLIAAGKDGTGETIVIIDAFGSPTLEEDLAAFDAVFGLPPPPSIHQIHMPGSPPFDYLNGNQLGWAEETSLDVQWAHAIAPGANIIVVAAVDNSFAAILDAQNYAIDHKLGHVMSESFGASEYALIQSGPDGVRVLLDNEKSYRRARRGHISVLVSSGDDGVAGSDANGNLAPFPVAHYPASSPQVTTVGGTNLFFGTLTNADPNGTYQGEVVWNDGFGATGGGVSMFFSEPLYQRFGLRPGVEKPLHGRRGYPDVAYNAGVVGGVIVHLGFLGPAFGPGANGFYIFGGTSASAPQWAGITAIGNQIGGKPLGFLNTRVYSLAALGILRGLTHDVTVGDNSFDGIPGYSAALGWDLTTGWGTPDFGSLLSWLCNGQDDDGSSDP